MTDFDRPQGGHLTTAQRAAVEALATGATKEQAAAVAGRSLRTLRRWLADDEAFRAAVRTAGDEAMGDSTRRLAGLLRKAITAVERDLDAGASSPAQNIQTLNVIARAAVRLREVDELTERVGAIEERLNDVFKTES